MKQEAENIRILIKDVAKKVNDFKKDVSSSEQTQVEDRGEVMANITLAYRHLEDASMRIGKAMQAYDGGISVYDKKTTVGVDGE